MEMKDDVNWWVFGQLNYYPINRIWYREKGKKLLRLVEEFGLNFYVKKDLRKTRGL